MATVYFPTVAGLNYPLKESTFYPKNRTEFENGAVQSRPRFTRAKRKFALKWDKLPLEEKNILEAFFIETGGGEFLWVHPLTGKEYTCLFSDDAFPADLVELDFYNVTVNIEEK